MLPLHSFEFFGLLLAGHFLADYPLQGDFLAKAKQAGPLRVWHLFGHSMIHGAMVGIITGSSWLGFLELILHMGIDECKNQGWTSFATDQTLHYACKCIIVGLLVQFPALSYWSTM